MSTTHVLIEPQYWGSLAYFQEIVQAGTVTWDVSSHYRKGSYRNRCHIMGPNGMLSLSVPLEKGKDQHTAMGKVRISYTENWRKDHWQSLVASYRRSAYFEYYEEDIAPLYEETFEYLSDLNRATLEVVARLLKQSWNLESTTAYIAPGAFEGKDLRDTILPNPAKMQQARDFEPYQQVFMDRMDFLPNLSILDALFNMGPRTLDYLKNIR